MLIFEEAGIAKQFANGGPLAMVVGGWWLPSHEMATMIPHISDNSQPRPLRITIMGKRATISCMAVAGNLARVVEALAKVVVAPRVVVATTSNTTGITVVYLCSIVCTSIWMNALINYPSLFVPPH